MSVLQSRLDQLEIVRQARANAQHTQSLNDISWGNQIRSYVLHVCILSFPNVQFFFGYKSCILYVLGNNKKCFDLDKAEIVSMRIMDSELS